MSPATTDKQIDAVRRAFRHGGGILRTGDEALDQGIHARTQYTMRDAGLLERLERGLYRLSDLPTFSDPDIATIANKIPRGVICLISALHFHDITTQIPHEVSIAVSRGTEPPRLDYPPIRLYWISGAAFTAGIETHRIDRSPVQIYSAEKTLADCFKYRNKIGMDLIDARSIKEDANNDGVRIRFMGLLGNARSTMQIDVGFGDKVHPGVVRADYPVILDLPAQTPRMYPTETVVAECMVGRRYSSYANHSGPTSVDTLS